MAGGSIAETKLLSESFELVTRCVYESYVYIYVYVYENEMCIRDVCACVCVYIY